MNTLARHLASSAAALLILAAAPATRAQVVYQTTDVETLAEFTFDDIVTCPLIYGSYVSGGEGCPTGRAPISGECGLSFDCPMPTLSIPDGLVTADHFWSQLVALPIVLDMGAPTETVFVMNAADHFPFPEEAIEWTVWGSDTPDVSTFPVGWTLSNLCAIFKQGWVESGACPAEDADDYVGLYQFDLPFRYVAVYANYSITIFTDKAHTLWPTAGDDSALPGWQSSEAELDAVARPDGPPPQIDAGPDMQTCAGYTLGFSATSTSPVLRWAWDATGDGIPEAAGPAFIWTFPTPGTYTVTLTALGTCGCATDSVEVVVRDCTLSVHFDAPQARRLDGMPGRVEVAFATRDESGTTGFIVERAAAPAGPWSLAGALEAGGTGATGGNYRLLDAAAPAADPLWYRIVEQTVAGAGEVSAAFAASPATLPGPPPPSLSRDRRRPRSR